MFNAPKKFYPGVMVSSTFTDLEKHRAALMQALQKEDLHPIGMETHVPKTDDDIISSSLNMVEKSAAYIGLISHRYGQIIESVSENPNSYSVTRLEYEKAQSLGLPTLIFIMDDDHPVKKSDIEIDANKIKKLTEFKEEAKKGRIYNVFKDLENFSRDAIHVVAQLRREIEVENQAKPRRQNEFVLSASNKKNKIYPPELYAQPPYIGSHKFVGRRAELEQLDDWANDADPHPVLLFEAIGGSGKSMLTWEWTKNNASKTRTDWAGKFWYSFYERGAQMADFCRHALAYITGMPFGHFEKKKTPELAQILLGYLRTEPWLFILDGLERVLVAYHRIDAAEIPDEEANNPTDKIINRDPRAAIKPEDDDLIRALASANPSKILISTRLTPKILMNPSGQPIGGIRGLPLTGLRPKDAETLIRSCGVHGDSREIQQYLSKHCDCHPLVTGILAGLIIDYLPSKGNFDAWAADSNIGGRKLNLGKLDLIQKRNHILKAALDNLNLQCKQLLSTLSFLTDAIDYPTLYAFNPHLSNGAAAAHPTITSQLQRTVKELEQRGFLQYDGKFHNLHPVVRGVVSGNLQSEEKLVYGQKVVDYFSEKSNTPYEDAGTLEDVGNALHIVKTLQKMGKFQEAVDVIRNGLGHALIFNLEVGDEYLAIMKPFFQISFNEIPKIVDPNDGGWLTNEMAITLSSLNKAKEAIPIFYTALEADLSDEDWESSRTIISNLGITFSDINKIEKSKQLHQWALELAELIESKLSIFVARKNYFSYLSMTGFYKEAQKAWEYIMKVKSQSWERAKYRPGSAEYSYCSYLFRIGELQEEYLEEAEKLSAHGRNRSHIRRLLILRGMWYMEQEKWEEASQYLSRAIEMSRSVGKLGLVSETLSALCKFKMGTLEDPASKATELSKSRNPHHLFLAELWETIGDYDQSEKYGLLSYKKYWGDGEPYVDRYYLDRTKRLLDRIGVAHPILSPYDPDKEERHPVEAKLIAVLEKLRKEKKLKEEEE